MRLDLSRNCYLSNDWRGIGRKKGLYGICFEINMLILQFNILGPWVVWIQDIYYANWKILLFFRFIGQMYNQTRSTNPTSSLFPLPYSFKEKKAPTIAGTSIYSIFNNLYRWTSTMREHLLVNKKNTRTQKGKKKKWIAIK